MDLDKLKEQSRRLEIRIAKMEEKIEASSEEEKLKLWTKRYRLIKNKRKIDSKIRQWTK